MANVSLNKTYTATAPHATYPDTGGTELTDGAVGSATVTDAQYCGWSNVNPTIRVDLTSNQDLSYVRFHYVTYLAWSVYTPASVVVKGSTDDVDYTTLGTFNQSGNWVTTDNQANWSNNLAVTGNYRYVQFNFTKGGAWTFMSEMEVYNTSSPSASISSSPSSSISSSISSSPSSSISASPSASISASISSSPSASISSSPSASISSSISSSPSASISGSPSASISSSPSSSPSASPSGGVWAGMGVTLNYSQIPTYTDILQANGFNYVRDLRDYTDSAAVAAYKTVYINATAAGLNCICGVSSNPTIITAENWNTFRLAVLDLAAWAQTNNMFEFQIGNEEETHYYIRCLEGSIVRASNVTTITFTSPHGFSGDYPVTVQNTYSDFNGTFSPVTIIDSTHVSYANTGADGTCVGDWSYVSDITQAEIITNLKSLATEVQAIYTVGNVSYTCIDHAIDDWAAAGRGDIDLIASNIYRNGAPGYEFDTDWQDNIDALITAFTSANTYIAEFSLSFNGLSDYSADIDVQASALNYMLNYIKDSGMTRALYFCWVDFSGYDGGVVESDGTTYKLRILDVLTGGDAPLFPSSSVSSSPSSSISASISASPSSSISSSPSSSVSSSISASPSSSVSSSPSSSISSSPSASASSSISSSPSSSISSSPSSSISSSPSSSASSSISSSPSSSVSSSPSASASSSVSSSPSSSVSSSPSASASASPSWSADEVDIETWTADTADTEIWIEDTVDIQVWITF